MRTGPIWEWTTKHAKYIAVPARCPSTRDRQAAGSGVRSCILPGQKALKKLTFIMYKVEDHGARITSCNTLCHALYDDKHVIVGR